MSLKTISLWLICLFSALPCAFAAIMVSSGGGQKISVGTPSRDIGFKITDEMGVPQTGVVVTFNLVDPSGKLVMNALSSYQAKTDAAGHIFTVLTPRTVVGIYTITATQSSSQFVSTYVTVVAGLPATLSVMQGDQQVIALGKTSKPITFRLTDAFGNVLGGESILFSVKNSLGEVSQAGPAATTDASGQVTTLFKPPDAGTYEVLATLKGDAKVVNSVTLQVEAPLPKLPSLGLGQVINPKGQLGRSEAIFYGGLAVNGGELEQEVILTLNDAVVVQGMIDIDKMHVGEAADIVVVVSYKPTPSASAQYYLLTAGGSYQLWDGKMTNLRPFMSLTSLPSSLVIPMYQGKFVANGELSLYFGYRPTDGNIVFNGHQTINILIKPAS